jgi:hypothetical protein
MAGALPRGDPGDTSSSRRRRLGDGGIRPAGVHHASGRGAADSVLPVARERRRYRVHHDFYSRASAFESRRENAAVLEQLSRILAQRLATPRGRVSTSGLTVAVFARAGISGKSLVAASLAGLLQEFSGRRTVLLRLLASTPSARRSVLLETLAAEPGDRLCAPQSMRRRLTVSTWCSTETSESTFTAALDQIASKLKKKTDGRLRPRIEDYRTLESAAEVADVIVKWMPRQDEEPTASRTRSPLSS